MTQVGEIIANGTDAGEVVERVARDPRWKAPGWRIRKIGLERFGGNVGMTEFVPDYLLASWRPVPFDWTPVRGSSSTQQRYVWTADHSRLQRELRTVRS